MLERKEPAGSAAPAHSKPYRAIFIVGKDHPSIPYSIKALYRKEGYLLLGDGVQNLLLLDTSVLRGKITTDTKIYILAHGLVDGGVHKIDVPTRDFLLQIGSYSEGLALNIHLLACYSGAAATSVSALPVGSVLITHGPKDYPTLLAINYKTILQGSQDLSVTDPVMDFAKRFTLNVKQTTTISIKKIDGSIFKHSVRPPRQLLTIPGNIKRYLEFQRSEFIKAYNKEFDPNIDISKLPEITEREAIEWRDDFLSAALENVDERVPAVFGSSRASNLPRTLRSRYLRNYYANALIRAASNGQDDKVITLLDIPGINVNGINYYGYTALMKAASNGHDKIVTALLAAPNVDINVKDKYGYTALMWAAYNGHDKAVTALLTTSVIDINAKDKNGRTACMIAVARGHDKVAAILAEPRIDLYSKIEGVIGAMDRDQAFNWGSYGRFSDKTPKIVQAIYREIQEENKAFGKGKRLGILPSFVDKEEVKNRLFSHICTALNVDDELVQQLADNPSIVVQALENVEVTKELGLKGAIKSAIESRTKLRPRPKPRLHLAPKLRKPRSNTGPMISIENRNR